MRLRMIPRRHEDKFRATRGWPVETVNDSKAFIVATSLGESVRVQNELCPPVLKHRTHEKT